MQHPSSRLITYFGSSNKYWLQQMTGPPNSVVNTRPESVHWSPARIRSSFWVVRWRRSIATTAAGSGTTRRERSVFGSLITRRPLIRMTVAATRNTPASRSTLSHRSASASPFVTRWPRSAPTRGDSRTPQRPSGPPSGRRRSVFLPGIKHRGASHGGRVADLRRRQALVRDRTALLQLTRLLQFAVPML